MTGYNRERLRKELRYHLGEGGGGVEVGLQVGLVRGKQQVPEDGHHLPLNLPRARTRQTETSP